MSMLSITKELYLIKCFPILLIDFTLLLDAYNITIYSSKCLFLYHCKSKVKLWIYKETVK
jgi:hypothetical protein